nr:MAG TPA: hypothetical protein [Caudoviricetes sp.]
MVLNLLLMLITNLESLLMKLVLMFKSYVLMSNV